MVSPNAAPATRRSFSRLKNPLDVPHLIDIQRRSFEELVDPKKGLLRATIDDISPTEDYTGNLAIVFGEFEFDDPPNTVDECREKDMTYSRPLNVKVAFQNRETGEIREQTVFMGDFPWMTDRGTFIINGTERVVVTQLVRSPGAYIMEPKDREKQVFIANLMPARGSWLELEIDKKGRVYVRIDRKRKLPVTVLLRAMGYVEDKQLLDLFDNSVYIRHTIAADTDATKTDEGALIELFKKQRPGEPPSVDAAKALLEQLFFDSKRYDLTRVGRYKLNARLDLDIDLDTRVLTHDDIIALVKELVGVPKILGIPEEIDEESPIKDYAAEAVHLSARAGPRSPRRVRALRQPPPADRRRADPGGLPDRALPDGAGRARAPHHRGRRRDHPADHHQHPPGGRRAEGVLRLLPALPVHGPDQLAGRAHPPPPALGPWCRRAHPRARPDRGPRRARHPLRADVPDRDAGGPEHRPDRVALLLRAGLRARLRHHPLPGGQGRRRHRRDRPPRRDPGGGADHRPGQRRGRSRHRQAQGPAGALSPARRSRRRRSAEAGGADGRHPDPDLVGGDGPDPIPRARRRQPGADGLQHAAPGGAAAEARAAPDRHRDGAARRGRYRRRRPRRRRRRGDLGRRREGRRQPHRVPPT